MIRTITGIPHSIRNAVFVAFYAEPTHLYQTNPDCRAWGEQAWYSKVSLLGVMMRWDGSLGFVGGSVDEGESLIEAVIREVKEETDYSISSDMLVPVCSHLMESGTQWEKHTHLFAVKLTVEQMYEMRNAQAKAWHGRVESAGMNVVHMVPDAPSNLLANKWAGTAQLELQILLDSGLIQPAIIEKND